MALRPVPLKALPAYICDWIEFQIIRSGSPFRFASLKRAFDTSRETEESDAEGNIQREEDSDGDGFSGEDADAFLDLITDEIADRVKALDVAYPFITDDKGRTLRLIDNLEEHHYIYLFCLFLTHSSANDVLDGSWLPAIDHQARDLFQGVSTLAAAGHVQGCAISFGWPRPDNSLPFLEKLRQVYARFGEGTVVGQPHAGASPSPKDEEIDVIAWRPQRDGAAGTIYLLGQVASGQNWLAKTVKGPAIDKFHAMWFAPAPVSVPTPSIFIPHAVLPNANGNRRDRMVWLSIEFGTVFDRLRLPHFASKGIQLADAGMAELYIERRDSIPAVIEWVDAQIDGLKALHA